MGPKKEAEGSGVVKNEEAGQRARKRQGGPSSMGWETRRETGPEASLGEESGGQAKEEKGEKQGGPGLCFKKREGAAAMSRRDTMDDKNGKSTIGSALSEERTSGQDSQMDKYKRRRDSNWCRDWTVDEPFLRSQGRQGDDHEDIKPSTTTSARLARRGILHNRRPHQGGIWGMAVGLCIKAELTICTRMGDCEEEGE